MDPGDTAFLDFLSAVNTAAAENGYDLLLSAAISTRQETRIYERLIGEMQVDGIILMGVRAEDPRINLLCERNFPFITFGRTAGQQDHAYVDIDGTRGIELAVQHLVDLGHTRLAYLQPPRGLMLSKQRWLGYRQAMAQNELKLIEDYIISCNFRESAASEAMEQLLSLPVPPTAVIAPNDITAFGTMQALKQHGLQPGVDVSVIGFDDIKLAAHWQPALTTIAQPFRRIGFEVVSALVGMITRKEARPQIQIEPALVVRQSTGPARK
jgi:DNA-binding LacI/PurR family transcriptional regulator